MNLLRLSVSSVLLSLCFTATTFAGTASNDTTSNTKKQPNIVLIMADDLGIGDLGCYNAKSKIPTPHLDKLAKSSMRFTDMHSPSSVCTPTRYGLLTGRYAWRTKLKKGVLKGLSPALINPNRMTIASLLKAKGYRTGCVGKWHLGLGNKPKTDYSKPLNPCPLDHGFDYFFGIPASLDMSPYVYVENRNVVEAATKQTKGSSSVRKGGKGMWRKGAIAPSFRHDDVLPQIEKNAVQFLERHVKSHREKPFFLYVPFSAPHTPWLPLKPFRGKSQAGVYGDFVTQVDATAGKILATLDQLKLAKNTLVIFTSDNGSHWGKPLIDKYKHLANLHYRGQKADIWDGGHRVPCIVRWPGIVKPNSTSNELLCLTDFFATAAAVTGSQIPNDAAEDSFNFLPVLQGALMKKSIRPSIVHHSISGCFAIRQGKWKLILGLGSGGFTQPKVIQPKPGGPKGQLYNLAIDASESKDVYQQNPQVVKALTELLEKQKTSGRSHPERK